jgi:hypothetical protein
MKLNIAARKPANDHLLAAGTIEMTDDQTVGRPLKQCLGRFR